MAEASDQERTHEPTPKKRKQAKEKGQIPRSKELSTFLLLMTSSAMLFIYGKKIFNTLADNMRYSLSFSREVLYDNSSLLAYLGLEIRNAFLILIPFFLALLVISVISNVMLGGWLFNIGLAAPKGERLNPLQGLKKMFSLKSLVELVKSIAKFGILITAGILILWKNFPFILHLTQENIQLAIPHGFKILSLDFIILSSVLILVALCDVPYQIWDHSSKLKMTFQEIKDEMKQTDANPEVKNRIRRIQQEMSQKRMMEELPKANVIITNPTHYAVALSYKPNESGAPIVVAKGMDFLAEKIRDAGKKYRIEIISSPPLARSIYYSSDLFKEIPQGLYVAVAQVLAYIYQLKQYRLGKINKPILPDELPIPDDLMR